MKSKFKRQQAKWKMIYWKAIGHRLEADKI